MQPSIQYPDAAQRIMQLMKSTFGPEGKIFNAYFLGVPNNFIMPAAAYPVLIVQKASGEFRVGPTMADDITENVYIHIVVNTSTGIGAPQDDNTVMRQLQTLVEGRDPSTGYLLPTSVMYALRTYITLQSDNVPGIVPINNNVRITYDATQQSKSLNTREAVIDITVDERQIVLNRR